MEAIIRLRSLIDERIVVLDGAWGVLLQGQGLTEATIARIHAPIGLNIGAVSPPEIAVSIMAEITVRLRLPTERAEKAA